MKRIFYFVVPTLFLAASCSSTPTPTDSEGDATAENLDGEALVQQKCYSCHNPEAPEGSRLAPHFFGIQRNYNAAYASETEFKAAIRDFVTNPSEDKALMKKAVEKHGLMPKMTFNEAELNAMADYIYSGTFENPKNASGELTPAQQGKEYALATKAVLGKNLMGQINAHGTDAALEFCNTKAFHFTDSMAQAQGVKIKRVSDQYRNPKNKANATELEYIAMAKSLLKAQKELKPKVTETATGYVGYYPILTNNMCLQCHGKKESEVKPSTLALLKQKYPGDKATGYGENELRGIWVVEWDK